MPLKYVKHHQLLAIERGVKEKALSLSIHFEGRSSNKGNHKGKRMTVTERKVKMLRYLVSVLRNHARCPYQNNFKSKKCYRREKILDAACEDAWKRLLRPSLIREVRKEMRENAHKDAIRCFADNVRNLLMTKPYYGHKVLGIDPGYRAGCKIAVVNEQGVVLETTTIWPTLRGNVQKRQRVDNSSKRPMNDSTGCVIRLIQRHKVTLVALGNGSAQSRSVEEWLSANILASGKVDQSLSYIIVNEAGASVYSTSKEAQKEFGSLDPLAIGAIALARRVQNPLSELVKVPPQSLGVGMYQHDLSPKDLEKHLDNVVSIVVSDIGVDVNNASVSLLRRVSGLNRKTAGAIFEHVRKQKRISCRDDLWKLKALGKKHTSNVLVF